MRTRVSEPLRKLIITELLIFKKGLSVTQSIIKTYIHISPGENAISSATAMAKEPQMRTV